MTDASPSQTEPAEPDSGLGSSGDGPGDAPQHEAPESPRWSDSQPAPAPWFVGQPGGGPQAQPQAGWGVAMPPQQPAPPQQPVRPEAPKPQTPEGAAAPERPEGQAPEVPEAPIAPPLPPQNPYDQPGPFGPPPPPVPPWQDPNRYGPPQRQQPDQRQNDPWQRQRPEQRPAGEQEKRTPPDLRTRWARGLALGAIACTMAAIWYSVSNFPTWMIGAGAGLVLGLVGLWLGVFAQRAAMAKGKRAPEAVGAIVWSSIASLLSLMILAVSLIFYTQLSQLSHCLRTATTISAQNQCETNFQNDFGTRA